MWSTKRTSVNLLLNTNPPTFGGLRLSRGFPKSFRALPVVGGVTSVVTTSPSSRRGSTLRHQRGSAVYSCTELVQLAAVFWADVKN
ncbi:Hypothetical predicted protein [Scomber scombrus]|uniref:Uncharacterized protein n=1 Tax=Scomber scombrus TaxID=13677 RepID=A0AAV1PKC0_SCOSC